MSNSVSRLVPPQRRDQMSELTAHSFSCFEDVPLCLVETDQGVLVVPSSDGGVTRAAAGDGVGLRVWGSSGNDALTWRRFNTHAVTSERSLGVDQTNESWILSDQAVIKWPMFATESVAAEKELLLQQAGFQQTPALWGHLWWQAEADGQQRLVATVSEFVSGSVDGWTWAPAALAADQTDWAVMLGLLAAEMHAAFRAGRVSHYAQGEAPVSALEGAQTQIVHGDFHLGQILRRGDELFVIDFDGDPMKSDTDNFQCRSVWLDVASMSSSIIHAGMVAIKRGAPKDTVYAAITQARDTFLAAYFEASHNRIDVQVLIELVNQIEQRELAYASQYLPRWLYAPEGALEYLRTIGEL